MKILTLTTLALSTVFLLGVSSPSQAAETSDNNSNIILAHGSGHHGGSHHGGHHGGHRWGHHGWHHHGGWNRGWGGGWNGGYNYYTAPAPCVGPLCPLIW